MLRFNSFLLSLALALLCSPSAHAIFPQTKFSSRIKAPASAWQFRNEQEVRALVARYINNPRAIYYIVNTAVERRLTHHATRAIGEHWQKSPQNPQLQMLSAYAYWAAATGYRTIPSLSGPGAEFNQLKSQAFSFTNSAPLERPNSPEVLVMASACSSTYLAENHNAFPKEIPKRFSVVLGQLRRAIRLDPKWADAHYWYGVALDDYHSALWNPKQPKNNAHLLSQAKNELLAAQRLDPNMKASCARRLASILEDQDRPREALAYLNTWLKLQPY